MPASPPGHLSSPSKCRGPWVGDLGCKVQPWCGVQGGHASTGMKVPSRGWHGNGGCALTQMPLEQWVGPGAGTFIDRDRGAANTGTAPPKDTVSAWKKI